MITRKLGIIALIATLAIATVALPGGASATTGNGTTVVTMGADLSPEQRQSIQQEMNVDSNVETIDVSIADIQQYLGSGNSGSSPAGGDNKAYSSAKITLSEEGSGIQVKANNVTQVTEQMYANALLTAGVKDADVYVTSPQPVTGTAALTGIMMAFEKASNQSISPEQRQVANQELQQTSELGQKIGEDKASDFMTKVKEEIAKQQPKNEEEVRDIIVNVAGDLNLNLNNQDVQNITNVMYQFSQLENIDWNAIDSQLESLKGDLEKVVNSPEAQGFFAEQMAQLTELFNSPEAQGFFEEMMTQLSELFNSLMSSTSK